MNKLFKLLKTVDSMAEHFALSDRDLPKEIHPTNYKTIMSHQQKDKNLIKIIKTKPKGYSLKHFSGAGKKYSLVCYNDRIVVPETLQKQ